MKTGNAAAALIISVNKVFKHSCKTKKSLKMYCFMYVHKLNYPTVYIQTQLKPFG